MNFYGFLKNFSTKILQLGSPVSRDVRKNNFFEIYWKNKLKMKNLARWRPNIGHNKSIPAFIRLFLGVFDQIEWKIKNLDNSVSWETDLKNFWKIFFIFAWRPYFSNFFSQKCILMTQKHPKKLILDDFWGQKNFLQLGPNFGGG